MKIRFIGTGSMASNSNSACYLINNHIMVDMPNGITKELQRKKLLKKIDNVIITHSHGDHFFDVPFILLRKLLDGGELTIYGSKDVLKKIRKITYLAFPGKSVEIFLNKDFKFVQITKDFYIDNLIIKPFHVYHGVLNSCYGYTFCDNKIVSITGDCRLCKNVLNTFHNSDYVIADCTRSESGFSHMGVNLITKLLNKNEDKSIIIPSHIGPGAKKELKKLKHKRLLIKEDYEEIEI